MKKKQVLRIISVVIGIVGVVVFMLGMMKYYTETSQQQQILKEFKWDDAGQLGTDDIVIESVEGTEQSSEVQTEVNSEQTTVSNNDEAIVDSEAISTEVVENVDSVVTE